MYKDLLTMNILDKASEPQDREAELKRRIMALCNEYDVCLTVVVKPLEDNGIRNGVVSNYSRQVAVESLKNGLRMLQKGKSYDARGKGRDSVSDQHD